MRLRIKRLDKGIPMPEYANPGDAGFDLRATEDVAINPRETVMVGTGIAVEIPEGHVGLVFPRSGLASKKGVSLANCVGVVDSGYRGEVKLPLRNAGRDAVCVSRGVRCAQMVVVPYAACELMESDELADTERGAGGFGSSGFM